MDLAASYNAKRAQAARLGDMGLLVEIEHQMSRLGIPIVEPEAVIPHRLERAVPRKPQPHRPKVVR